ncbi:hypothetical protein JCM6882_000735 [Rhodosporidiobolus microsporus]
MLLFLALAVLAVCFKEELKAYFSSPPPPPQRTERKSESAIAVVLINGDGDKLDPDLVSLGACGGLAESEGKETIVYLVGNLGKTTKLARSHLDETFVRGFAASSKLSVVVPPFNAAKGYAERIIQIFAMYLTLDSVNRIYLGSLHSDQVGELLEGVPDELREKVILLPSVNVSPIVTRLIDESKFQVAEVLMTMETVEEDVKQQDVKDSDSEAEDFPLLNFHPVAPKHKPRSALIGRNALPTPQTTPPPAPFKVPKARFHPAERPCNNYYLSPNGCSNSNCTFSHHYSFTAEEWAAFPALIKSFVCPYMRDHGHCNCPYTPSACPYGIRCHYLKAGLPHSAR